MYTGGTGSAPGQFAEPRGIALDKFKHVYAADTGNGRIQEFSSDGNLVRTIGEAGTGEGQLDRPTGVAVTTNRHIHVATADGRVHEYDADGTAPEPDPRPRPGFGPLADIAAVDNRVFVLDPDNGRVVKIDENGTETSFGSVGDGPDQLREPTGIAAFNYSIHVADTGNAGSSSLTRMACRRTTYAVPEWAGATERTADLAGDGSGRTLADEPGRRRDPRVPRRRHRRGPSRPGAADRRSRGDRLGPRECAVRREPHAGPRLDGDPARPLTRSPG